MDREEVLAARGVVCAYRHVEHLLVLPHPHLPVL
jgi:hypothetical protein